MDLNTQLLKSNGYKVGRPNKAGDVKATRDFLISDGILRVQVTFFGNGASEIHIKRTRSSQGLPDKEVKVNPRNHGMAANLALDATAMFNKL